MMNYTVTPKALTPPMGNLLGFADVTIDDAFVVTGFKIFKNASGDLFVSSPSQESKKLDADGKKTWYPTVYFVDQKDSDSDKQTPRQKEMFDAILAEFNALSGGKKTTSTPTTTAKPKTSSATLWGKGK